MENDVIFYILAIAMFVNILSTSAKKNSNLAQWEGPIWDEHYKKYTTRTDTKSVPFQRQTRLYSKASREHVQIINGTVNGLGKGASEFARLVVESDTFGRVKIRGVKTGRYLCMTNNGRLVGRKKKAGIKEKRRKCIFIERTLRGYRLYESVKHPKWFIAINRRGRVVPGPLSTRGIRSRLFMPRDYRNNIGRGRDALERARISSRRRRMKRLRKRLRMRRRHRSIIGQWLS